jgi:hypothetical protein
MCVFAAFFVFSNRKTEMDIVIIFVFVFFIKMKAWAEEKTSLIERIRKSSVWDTKSKE